MARGLAVALHECLTALGAGESIDACLARYPQHAEELRTYLPLAHRLTMTPRHEPRPGAQTAAWQRFSARAEDLRLGRKPPLSLGWLRPLTIAAAVLLAIVGAAGGTTYASQDALPDSPLYRVKLFTEDARVWLTFDESGRAELLLDQSNERTDEIMDMLRNGKEIPGSVLTALRERNARAVRILEDHPEEQALLTRAREQSAGQEDLLLVLWGDLSESAQDDYAEAVATLHNAQLRTLGAPGSVRPDDVAAGVIKIAGSAEPAGEGVWLLGGVEVSLDARTRGETQFESGRLFSVIAARGVDGRLLALHVTATDGLPADRRYIVSGAVEELDDEGVVIAGQRIAITANTLMKLRLQRGQQVEISVDDIDGQAVASRVEGPPRGEEEQGPPLLAYEGIIEDEISTGDITNDWVVGGQEFTVTPSTEIDARGGVLAEGGRVRVEAVAEDGKVIAKRVVVLENGAAADAIRVEGVLENGDEKRWVVSGVEVEAPAGAETPEIGSLVTLEARRKEKRLVPEKLFTVFVPGRSGLALLSGPIKGIGEDGAWQVGLVSVAVPDEAVVLGEPQVGSRVFIWGSRDGEGPLRAAYVNVLDRKPLLTPSER